MTLVACLLVIIAIHVLLYYYKRRKLPPGPPTIPLLGSMPFLPFKGAKGFLDASLAKKFGKICTIDIPGSSMILINDLELAKELFNKDVFSGRPSFHFSTYIKGYDGFPYGIISSNGSFWQTQRRFSLIHLKNFGFGRKSLESAIYEEVAYLFDIIENEKDASGDILVKEIFNIPIINVIWQIIGSTRLNHFDSDSHEFVEAAGTHIKKGLGLKEIFPTLAHILPYNKEDMSIIKLKRIIERMIEEHEEILNENAPRDFIDTYLIEMHKGLDSNFSKKQLVSSCMDFFLAGSETSSTTLTWMLLFMARHEEIQERCYQEIMKEIGSSPPREEDMKTLPYCMATLSEIQRLGNTVPGSLLHINTEIVTIEGYEIPKNTYFMANLKKFHLDPDFFPDPLTFDPNRFLNSSKQNRSFVPFGFGKRVCMGISMAKKELYYFFIMVIQSYKIIPSKGRTLPDPENYTVGITACPNPFYIQMNKRIEGYSE